jgi:hypothetical protein
VQKVPLTELTPKQRDEFTIPLELSKLIVQFEKVVLFAYPMTSKVSPTNREGGLT